MLPRWALMFDLVQVYVNAAVGSFLRGQPGSGDLADPQPCFDVEGTCIVPVRLAYRFASSSLDVMSAPVLSMATRLSSLKLCVLGQQDVCKNLHACKGEFSQTERPQTVAAAYLTCHQHSLYHTDAALSREELASQMTCIYIYIYICVCVCDASGRDA